MGSRKKAVRPLHSEDDIDIANFAREFFGTHQEHDDHSLPSETVETHHEKDCSRRKPKHNAKLQQEIIPGSQEETVDKYGKRGSNVQNKNAPAAKQKHSKGKKSSESAQHVPARDLRQVILSRFLELRDEFRSLSERLDRVNMAKVSKRLTQVLAERQRLMVMLLEMGATRDSALIGGEDERTYSKRIQSQVRFDNEGGFGMPKKTKSVHWSDEFLGGSIIQDPTVDLNVPIDPQPTSTQASISKHKRNLDRREDSALLSQKTRNPEQRRQDETYSQHREKSPPSYKMVDSFTQTYRRRTNRTESHCDTEGGLCSLGIGHAVGCVEDIVNEAAALRRQACCMLWRAHYLEQLCDADGIVKHVYYSASDVPALPRYPHWYK